jgi:cytochrome c-type biogenesis protein CcmH/NrfF
MLIDYTGKEMSHEDVNGVFTENPPPETPIWTQLWFQAALTIVVIAAVAAVFVAIRRRIVRKVEEYSSYHPESSLE